MAKKSVVVPTESEEQKQFFRLAKTILPPNIYNLLWATPNGGLRDVRVAMVLKAEGVKAGVPDITLAYPSALFNGLFIEMKRIKGGRVSVEQKEMMQNLKDVGYRVEVCKGCDSAIAVLLDYLGMDNPIQ